MHFFYLDESGCTGRSLTDRNQPIFVMGGISVRDDGWNETHRGFSSLIRAFFDKKVPPRFELHAHQLLSRNGEGPFIGFPIEDRLDLARQILSLVADRKHAVHFVAIDKAAMRSSQCEVNLPFDPHIPYVTAFDYMITYINDYVKARLGSSARGLVILDKKDQFQSEIEAITRTRRSEGPAAHRVKWIVEFSYPVDSLQNPMIQMSDLVVLCIRRFLENELGYKDEVPEPVRRFYAECFNVIYNRVSKKSLVERGGRDLAPLNSHLSRSVAMPRRGWKNRYGLT